MQVPAFMSLPDPIGPNPLPEQKTEEVYKELDFNDEQHRLLSCPKCNHLISGNDINIEKTIAKCSHCHHVFGFSHDSKIGGLVPELIPPEGVEVLKLRSELDIQLDWKKTASKGGKTFLTAFTFLWNLILLPFVLMILISGQWGILLLMSLHLADGLGLMLYIAGLFLKKTSISLSRKRMKIRTIPIPIPLYKAKELEIDRITQFYVTQYTASTTNGVPNYAYALYAILDNGDKVPMLRGMNRETHHYIEQQLEGYLGIQNRRIQGEDTWK
jgi:hypothetical protein